MLRERLRRLLEETDSDTEKFLEMLRRNNFEVTVEEDEEDERYSYIYAKHRIYLFNVTCYVDNDVDKVLFCIEG